MLLGVAVIGFVVIHHLLRKDVTDTAAAVSHPFGQAFDDWFNNLVGGPTVTTPASGPAATGATDPATDPNFGLQANSWDSGVLGSDSNPSN